MIVTSSWDELIRYNMRYTKAGQSEESRREPPLLSQQQYWDIDKHYSKASQVLDEAKSLAERYQHDLSVRRAQEAFELLLKTMLLFMGREYPKDHDVGNTLYDVPDLFQELGITTERVAQIVLRSKTLELWRDRAFYGDERLKVTGLFVEPEASLAVRWAEEMRNDCYFVKTKVLEGALKSARSSSSGG